MSDTIPFLQIGEAKYGKFLLELAVRAHVDLQTAAKIALGSMLSTAHANLSVGPPYDAAVYRNGSLDIREMRIEADHPYLAALNKVWIDELIDFRPPPPADPRRRPRRVRLIPVRRALVWSAAVPAPADELLDRVARTLREQVGPAVEEPFAKTQAFMAAVILGKLAGQLRHHDADERAADADRHALVTTLREVLARPFPPTLGSGVRKTNVSANSWEIRSHVADAVEGLAVEGGDAAWNRLVVASYDAREELGDEVADELLAAVRVALRARLDRALAYSA